MSNKTEEILFDFLNQQNIPYSLFEHQPVFTVDDIPLITAVDGIAKENAFIPKPHFKTLFLKDKNNKFFLVSVIEDKRVDLNALSKTLECGRFSFGTSEELFDLMKLTPGSVTPFGLIFDNKNNITFVLDEDALNYQYVSFHPLRNDMTIVLATKDFIMCLEKMAHKPLIARIITKNVS